MKKQSIKEKPVFTFPQLIFIAVFVLSFQGIIFGLDDLWIWEDVTITSGESYGEVQIFDNVETTTVEFYGSADHFVTNDSSTLNIQDGGAFIDGSLGYHTLLDDSTVNLYSGGHIGITSMTSVYLYNSSSLNVYGGQISTFLLAQDSSTINFYDGDLSYEFGLYDNSEMHLYGGNIVPPMTNHTLDPTANLYIYGTDFQYDPQGYWTGLDWVSKLTGTNLDSEAITYWGIPDPASNPNIIFVPEPGTVLLFGLGGFVLRRKKA